MNTEDSEFKRIEREQAMRGVPDAMHHTDTSESLQYIQGWNECRQAMLAEQPAQQEPAAWRYTDAQGHFRYRGFVDGFDRAYPMLKPQALYTNPQRIKEKS